MLFFIASSPSRFTPDHLSEGVRAKVRVDTAGGDHIHLSSEEVFEVEGEVHEVPEGRLSPVKLDEDIDIACRGLLAAGDGAEDADPFDSEGFPDHAKMILQAPEGLSSPALSDDGAHCYRYNL